MRYKNYINEITLSRVWKHFMNAEMSVLIITAFRGKYTEKQNIQRNKELASKAKKAGLGYVYVDGHWIEKDGGNEGREDSIMIMSEDDTLLRSLGIKWMKEYDQDAILFKPLGTDTYLIFNSGKEQKLGKVSIKDIQRIKSDLNTSDTDGSGYTKLRGRGNRTFVFETIREESGWIMKAYGNRS